MRDRLMCPACHRRNRAWVFSQEGHREACAFCDTRLRKMSEIVGAEWEAEYMLMCIRTETGDYRRYRSILNTRAAQKAVGLAEAAPDTPAAAKSQEGAP